MEPEALFNAHLDKAEKIATSLCWRYRVSGALSYQEEAKSEARLALWRACRNFDPCRQELEIRKIRQHGLALFWNPIFGAPPPPNHDQDPFSNFWIWAVRQIYGRVIDWFRSYHLIKRMAKDEKPSMIYHERFISMTRWGWDGGYDGEAGHEDSTYANALPSQDVSDSYDDVEAKQVQIRQLVKRAGLSRTEIKVLRLTFGDDEMSKAEIAEVLGITATQAGDLFKSVLAKLKEAAAQAQCMPVMSRSCFTTPSILRPMLRPGI